MIQTYGTQNSVWICLICLGKGLMMIALPQVQLLGRPTWKPSEPGKTFAFDDLTATLHMPYSRSRQKTCYSVFNWMPWSTKELRVRLITSNYHQISKNQSRDCLWWAHGYYKIYGYYMKDNKQNPISSILFFEPTRFHTGAAQLVSQGDGGASLVPKLD